MRDMEKFTRDVGGYPFLYADIFMSKKEFEEMFDLTGTYEPMHSRVWYRSIEPIRSCFALKNFNRKDKHNSLMLGITLERCQVGLEISVELPMWRFMGQQDEAKKAQIHLA